jgi:peptidoglycan-associated lipoprotein
MLMRTTQLAKIMVVAIALCGILTGCKLWEKRSSWDFWNDDETVTPAADDVALPMPPPIDSEMGFPGTSVDVLPPIESLDELVGAVPLSTERPGEVSVLASGLETVYFDFDSSRITDLGRETLNLNAEWLIANPELVVQVEGHCDERGPREYNFALGERRALAVREYLISKGVNPNNLLIISYGEERPLALGASEEAWGQNRRAQFMVFQD